MGPEEYTYIAAWGEYLGSEQYYIKEQQQQAAADNAPVDALFRRVDGSWFCRKTMQVVSPSIGAAVDTYVRSGGVE